METKLSFLEQLTFKKLANKQKHRKSVGFKPLFVPEKKLKKRSESAKNNAKTFKSRKKENKKEISVGKRETSEKSLKKTLNLRKDNSFKPNPVKKKEGKVIPLKPSNTVKRLMGAKINKSSKSNLVNFRVMSRTNGSLNGSRLSESSLFNKKASQSGSFLQVSGEESCVCDDKFNEIISKVIK